MFSAVGAVVVVTLAIVGLLVKRRFNKIAVHAAAEAQGGKTKGAESGGVGL
jgi:hypothetical protein